MKKIILLFALIAVIIGVTGCIPAIGPGPSSEGGSIVLPPEKPKYTFYVCESYNEKLEAAKNAIDFEGQDGVKDVSKSFYAGFLKEGNTVKNNIKPNINIDSHTGLPKYKQVTRSLTTYDLGSYFSFGIIEQFEQKHKDALKKMVENEAYIIIGQDYILLRNPESDK